MLGRITKRLGHGCSLTDLIGRGRVGEASSAAEDLLLAVGETLTATARRTEGEEPVRMAGVATSRDYTKHIRRQ